MLLLLYCANILLNKVNYGCQGNGFRILTLLEIKFFLRDLIKHDYFGYNLLEGLYHVIVAMVVDTCHDMDIGH